MTNKKTMSIMELAYLTLQEQEKAMTFIEIYDKICEIKEISDEEKAENISQVYADFITSAKFIYVGDDEWDIKGRRAIDLWDKDGAYYDEYPDYEEELSLYDEDKEPDEYTIDEFEEESEEDEEGESPYEDDFDEDDIEDDESEYDEFEEDEEDYIEDEEDLMFEDEDDEFHDEEEEEEEEETIVEEEEEFDTYEEEESEDFDDEEYNEYMDDYEKMYDD